MPLEYYRRPNRAKKCKTHVKWVPTSTGGRQAVLTTKGRKIAEEVEANKKQCIVLGQRLQAAADAKPFVQEDLLKAINGVKELLTVYDVKAEEDKMREAVHCFLTLGGTILIPVEIALKAIESFKEGIDRTVIDAILPIIGLEMWQGFKMNPMCKLWSIADDWERHEENKDFPMYVLREVLIKKWEWFLELEKDEEAYCQKVVSEPGITWENDEEYDGADDPKVEVGAKSDSDDSTDSEENGDYPGN